MSIMFILFNNFEAQSLNILTDFEEDIIHFDYNYEEYNNFAYSDSSIILESLKGIKNVYIDSNSYSDSGIHQYFLTIETKGIKILKTFYDTLAVDSVYNKKKDSVFIKYDENTIGGEHYIYGWIFPDTLLESVVDSFDITPMYPYSKLYQIYKPENDDSLYYRNDTLFIHYRPISTNYNDFWFILDYYIERNHGLEYYSKDFGYYYGTQRKEVYRKTGTTLISNVSSSNELNTKFYLSQNYPNPFNPITKIKFSIPSLSKVEIVVYDILGRRIISLVNEIKNSGEYEIEFDGTNLSSGVYYYTMRTNNNIITKKLLLIK